MKTPAKSVAKRGILTMYVEREQKPVWLLLQASHQCRQMIPSKPWVFFFKPVYHHLRAQLIVKDKQLCIDQNVKIFRTEKNLNLLEGFLATIIMEAVDQNHAQLSQLWYTILTGTDNASLNQILDYPQRLKFKIL